MLHVRAHDACVHGHLGCAQDFNGEHPDPNLKYAPALVKKMGT